MIAKNGFTLLEILVVLSILSVLILLSTPFNANMLEAKRENEFFKLLKSDMLYAQSLASATDSDVLVSMSFDAENNRYSIIRDRTVQKRSFPDDWILDQDYIFYFNQKGTVLNPYTLNLKTSNARYQIVFPFGKGRGYIEEK
ncbi:MAG TPA: competence type IV pilus minor pilin ComGD [Bacillota bacterium]|nr:competence type IV pilus minor pilin ComGD [Bacillota bacterium]